MSKRLIADGMTGRVAIQEGNSREVFENPASNFDSVYFHSDLDYLAVIEVYEFDYVTLPGLLTRRTQSVDYGKGKRPNVVTYTLPQTGTGSIFLGTLSSVPGPIVAYAADESGYIQMPLGQISFEQAGYPGEVSLAPTRTIWINVINGNQVYLQWQFFTGGTIEPYTLRKVKLVKFKELNDAVLGQSGNVNGEPPLAETLRINADRFIASKGRLDSKLRYVTQAPLNSFDPALIALIVGGRSADADSGGFAQIALNAGQSHIVKNTHYKGYWDTVSGSPDGSGTFSRPTKITPLKV